MRQCFTQCSLNTSTLLQSRLQNRVRFYIGPFNIFILTSTFAVAVRIASVSSCVVFMPRMDLWAVETPQQVIEESESLSTTHQFPGKDDSDMILKVMLNVYFRFSALS